MAAKLKKAPATLLEKIRKLLEANLFLYAEQKTQWTSQLSTMDDVELEGLLRILEKNQKDFKQVVVGFLAKDPQGRIAKQWKTFKRQKMKEIGQNVQKKEAEKAEQEMEKQLK